MPIGFYFVIAVIVLLLLGKFLSFSLKLVLKLVVNAVLGFILLFVVNVIGATFGFSLGVNALTVLIAGFFGIPGVVFLIIFKLFM